MRTCLVLVACLLANVCFAKEKNGAFTNLSMGTKSCGAVVSDRDAPGEAKMHNSVWVAGYLTAYNEYVVGRKNIAAGTDPAAWDLWIHNYCTANPLENLAAAASALVAELLKRKQ